MSRPGCRHGPELAGARPLPQAPQFGLVQVARPALLQGIGEDLAGLGVHLVYHVGQDLRNVVRPLRTIGEHKTVIFHADEQGKIGRRETALNEDLSYLMATETFHH